MFMLLASGGRPPFLTWVYPRNISHRETWAHLPVASAQGLICLAVVCPWADRQPGTRGSRQVRGYVEGWHVGWSSREDALDAV